MLLSGESVVAQYDYYYNDFRFSRRTQVSRTLRELHAILLTVDSQIFLTFISGGIYLVLKLLWFIWKYFKKCLCKVE